MKKFFLAFFSAVFFISALYSQSSSEILGELFVDENDGFSMYIPIGWEEGNLGSINIIMGPIDNGFSPNMTFGIEVGEYSGSLTEYIDAVIQVVSTIYTNLKIAEKRSFSTNSGIRGETAVIQGSVNNMTIRQKLYCFRSKDGSSIMVITGTAVAEHSERYDAVFDACVKTFSWSK
jgi:hypothetical protein